MEIAAVWTVADGCGVLCRDVYFYESYILPSEPPCVPVFFISPVKSPSAYERIRLSTQPKITWYGDLRTFLAIDHNDSMA